MNLDEAVAAAKAQYPGAELLQLGSASGQFVFRVPTSTELGPFRKRISDRDQRAGALENLVRTCLVYPDRAGFDAAVLKRPMLIEKWGDELTDAAGGAEDIEVKKL